MLRVWGRRNSLNVQKVMWLVGELGLAHEHVPAGGDFGRLDEPAFRALNPHGRVPVIEDGEAVVWESHAILRYLAARYGGERFFPPDPAVRARAEAWMDWQQSSFQPAFSNDLFWGWFRTPEAQRDPAVVRRGMSGCARGLRLVDGILAGRPYLAGDQLSLADIPLGTCLFRYFGLDIEHPDVPNVRRWYERLQARDAYREHVMLPFEDLRGRLAF